MKTKIWYKTTDGKVFKTIANIYPAAENVDLFMNLAYDNIAFYGFRPSIKSGYKRFVNVSV